MGISKRLDNDKGGLVETLATKLLDSLKTDFRISISLDCR
jgi:hypothetical protein